MDNKREFKLVKTNMKLTPNKWYDASLFTKEELELLLPIGTLVEVLVNHIADTENHEPLLTDKTKVGKVESVSKGSYTKIYIAENEIAYYWFKIVN